MKKLTAALCAALMASIMPGCAAAGNAKQSDETAQPAPRQSVVFAGDSLTARCDLERYYPDYDCTNCGLDGDTVAGVAARLDEICLGSPDALVLLIGTNNIIGLSALPEPLCGDIAALLDDIASRLPSTRLLVQSLYPTNDSVGLPVSWTANDRIAQTNELLEKLCGERGIVYIDVHPLLCGDEGGLRAEYTLDGVHLSDAGYAVACDAVNRALNDSL